MTSKQSLTRKQSLIQRSVAVLSAALLAAAWVVGISIPASAAPVKGFLQIVSITDQSGLGGPVPNDPRPLDNDVLGPVQNRSFNVVVRVLDRPPGEPNAQTITVSKATTIALEMSGTGALEGRPSAVIPRDGSSATISGAKYSQFENGVDLRVVVDRGVELAPDEITVEVALKAVGDNASPHTPLTLTDSTCAAPTTEVPTCGRFLLPNGGSGHVTLSINSCEGLGNCKTTADGLKALVVTGIANLKDANGKPLYSKTSPATLVVACDKDLCRETANGVPKLPLIYTLNNIGPLDKTTDGPDAGPCPAKGVIGQEQEACVDYVSSSRNKGDLYLHFLFVADGRSSF
jgi:hypothetical protein